MGGLGIWLRAEARRRWRAWVAIAVIAGVGWGAVLTAVAGARRTDSAFTRFRATFNGRDVLASPFGNGIELSKDVAALPEVTSSGRLIGMNAFVVDPKPPKEFAFGAPLIALDDRFARTIDRPKILRGRMPRLEAADEAFVSPSFVEPLEIDLGDWVTLRPQTGADPGSGQEPVPGKTFRVRIVGIGVTQSEAFPLTTFDRLQPLMVLSPAAYTAYWKPAYSAFDGVVVRLRAGTNVSAFQEEVKDLQKRHPESGEDIFFSSEADRPVIARRAFRPQVAALIAFAAALAVTLLLVLSQSVGRQISLHSVDYPALRAIGMSPGRIMIAAIVPATAAAFAAAVISIATAILASPLTPVGQARLAEPNPGIAIDPMVLGLGALSLVVWLIVAAAIPARRVAVSRLDAVAASRPSSVAEGLTRAGASVPASAGVRMALESGRGSTAVPVRTVIASAVVSMIALSAAYTFGASLDRAVTTPRIFGQQWDADVDAQFDTLFPARLGYANDPSYEAVAAGVYGSGQVVIGGRSVTAIGIDTLKGSVFPTLLDGRPPRAKDEIVLGTSTLRLTHGRIGEMIDVQRPGEAPTPMRIVGRAVLPAFGIGAFTPTGLGDGAIMTAEAVGRGFLPPGGYSFMLVRFSKHPSPATVRRVDGACDEITLAGELCIVHHAQDPPEIDSYRQVRNVSWVLAGVLAALTAATLGHGLIATVRRRRRDLAVLKTLGFVRRQISATVAWQASTLVLLALAGIPLGIAVGRWGWTSLAGQLGIPAEPRVPMIVVGATIPAALLLANLVAALPGRVASKTSAALVLRTE